MSDVVVIVVLIVALGAMLLWAEYYRRKVDSLQRDNASLRAMLDYRKK